SFMHDIFREYLDKFMIVYLDDVLVFSDDWESHVQQVSSPKFKPRFIGPYRILEILNPVSFRLDLPASFAIHNVFHRSLLRKYEIQGNEQKKTMEQDVLRKFDDWKKEEREKFEHELNKVREMFMKELKEVTSKNSSLENELHDIKKDSLHRRSGLGVLQESPRSDTEEGKSKCPHDIQSVKELLEVQQHLTSACGHPDGNARIGDPRMIMESSARWHNNLYGC
ncbi:unnamed protein product, partial [Ranitomeya imitator]